VAVFGPPFRLQGEPRRTAVIGDQQPAPTVAWNMEETRHTAARSSLSPSEWPLWRRADVSLLRQTRQKLDSNLPLAQDKTGRSDCGRTKVSCPNKQPFRAGLAPIAISLAASANPALGWRNHEEMSDAPWHEEMPCAFRESRPLTRLKGSPTFHAPSGADPRPENCQEDLPILFP
jgi:hypothetical protein